MKEKSVKQTSVPRWHKLPPVPGWYAVTLLHKGEVEAMGTGKFSEWKISETREDKNTRYYGPLPVEEVENETTPCAD